MKKSDKFLKWLFQIMPKVQSTDYVALYDAVFPSYFLFCALINLNNVGQGITV